MPGIADVSRLTETGLCVGKSLHCGPLGVEAECYGRETGPVYWRRQVCPIDKAGSVWNPINGTCAPTGREVRVAPVMAAALPMVSTDITLEGHGAVTNAAQNCLKVFCLNVHNVKTMLETLDYEQETFFGRYDVLIFVETHLTKESAPVEFDGFDSVQKCRSSSAGGGLSVYAKKTMTVREKIITPLPKMF